MVDNNVAIHICNSALYRLGEEPIASFAEGTPKADLCKEIYPDVRDTLLSWQAWPFATVRQSLSRLAASPLSDYSYYYQLPVDPAVLRVIDIDLTSRQIDYQREVYVNPANPAEQRAVIATNVTSVVMRYVGRTVEGIWSPLFVATMAVWLAASMEPSISRKPTMRATLLEELYGKGREPGLLAKLRDITGYEDSPRAVPFPTSYEAVRTIAGSDSAPTQYRW
jgi:hypothetical protein